MAIIESYMAMVPIPVAILVSVLVNIVISIIGVLPSAFLTAINVTVFGFWGGFSVSLIGEIAGSLVAFWLYRKGFRKFVDHRSKHTPRMKKLLDASPREAFLLVIGLRLMPFVPSGLVTLYAAVSKMRFGSFAVASSMGKVPALLIEVSTTYAVVKWLGIGQFIVFGLAIAVLFMVWIKMKQGHSV
jgi:uncharacterized membrane protein YdjX (TVP38/TMEM64 family)